MVLPRSMRLKGYKCFNYLYKEGSRFNGTSMLLRVVSSKPELLKVKDPNNGNNCLRCAVSISNKVSKRAVTRNKLRRFFHQHLKEKLKENALKKNCWAILSLKPISNTKNSYELIKEFDNLLTKADLLS